MINKKITIIVGCSSIGKDYALNYLVSSHNYKPLISHTTRPIRPNEKKGREYHFVNDKKFLKMIKNKELIEYRTYNTLQNGVPSVWYYGLSKKTIDNLDPNSRYVTIFDIQGAKNFIEYYGKDNCFVVMIRCDDKIREERAKSRGGYSVEEWSRRLLDDNIVFSDENTKGLINWYIENNGTVDEFENELVNLNR